MFTETEKKSKANLLIFWHQALVQILWWTVPGHWLFQTSSSWGEEWRTTWVIKRTLALWKDVFGYILATFWNQRGTITKRKRKTNYKYIPVCHFGQRNIHWVLNNTTEIKLLSNIKIWTKILHLGLLSMQEDTAKMKQRWNICNQKGNNTLKWTLPCICSLIQRFWIQTCSIYNYCFIKIFQDFNISLFDIGLQIKILSISAQCRWLPAS